MGLAVVQAVAGALKLEYHGKPVDFAVLMDAENIDVACHFSPKWSECEAPNPRPSSTWL